MKRAVPPWKVLILLVLAGTGGLALVTLRLRSQRDVLAGEIGLALARSAGLEGDLRAARERQDFLGSEVAALSNRVDEAVARLEEERSVHDPLRRQIEVMAEKTIDLSAHYETVRMQAAKEQEQLARLREQIASQEGSKGDFERRLAELQEAVRVAADEQSQLQSKVEHAEAQLAAQAASTRKLESELAQARESAVALGQQHASELAKAREIAVALGQQHASELAKAGETEAALRRQLAEATRREAELKKALDAATPAVGAPATAP